MSSKRVWLLCSNRWNSAITEYALRSAQALQRAGWSSFYSPLAKSPGAQRARAMGLDGPEFADFGPGSWPMFIRELRRIQPDALLLFGGPETFLSRGAASSIPKLRFRGQDNDVAQDLPTWRTRFGLSHCAGVITPGALLQDRFAGVLDGKPVWNIPLGLEASQFQFQSGALAEVARPTLRLVGRLDPIKGHKAFFQLYASMLALWAPELPHPFLEVIGQAANLSAETLRAYASTAGLIEGEHWTLCAERLTDLPQRMRATHLGVIPSLGSEVICRVAEEFLLAGCPLFVSGVGTLGECLFSDMAGVNYAGLSEKEAAERLRTILEQAFRESDRERFLRSEEATRRFSLERMGAELVKALEAVL